MTHERHEHDSYRTPAWCVDRLLEACDLPGGIWFDPCAGDGALIKAVQANDAVTVARWHAVEIRTECHEALKPLAEDGFLYIDDYLGTYCGDPERHVLFMNPPFSTSFEFVQKAQRRGGYVVALLRLCWLASAKRAAFLRANPPDVYVLPNRPSFVDEAVRTIKKGPRKGQQVIVKDPTDNCDYAWFVWPPVAREHGTIRVLAETPRAERCTTREESNDG